MRINFKKITALATTALFGISLAALPVAAANFPAPFVVGGSADVAVIHGTGSGVSTLDMVQAGNIQTSLQSFITGSGGSSVSGGDSVQLSKATDMFNLGNAANVFITTIDGDDLSVVLADGVYRNDGNDEFDYEQEVTMGTFTLAHFADNDFNNEEPVIGFDLADGTHILNYTLDFTPDNAESDTADWNELEGTTINMLGKEYYILSASNATAGSESLDLLDSASDSIVNSGETVSVTAGGVTYQVSLAFIDDDEVRLTINGETTPSLNEDDTYRLDSGAYIGIKEISFQNFAGGAQQAEFSIGAGKIELVNGAEVEVNNEDVSDLYDHTLTSFVTANGQNLDSITISWAVDDDFWLAFGTDSRELEMPAFGNVKLALGNFVTDAAELTEVGPNGDDRASLDTTVTDGDVSVDILFTNTTHFTGIGKDADELLETDTLPHVNWTANSRWFVATWVNGDDFESYVLEISDIDDSTADNTTRIRSVATGSNQAIDLDIGETDEIGEISFTLDAAFETGELADITIAAAGGTGTVNASRIVTAEGLQIQLPFNSTGAGVGALDLNNSADATWLMHFTEEDKDGDVAAGVTFNATLGHTADGEVSVTTVHDGAFSGDADFETSDGSDDFVGYIQSDLATMTLLRTGGDQDDLQVTYHGTEAYGEVFLSETGASITGEAGELLVTDSELSSVQSRNLIVVGGSCINSAAASLVGGALCGSSWTSSTGVGSGQFLIQSYGDAFTSGKIALLVAGYEAADTVNAATYLRTQTVDTAAGNKYVGTSSTSAELQVS